MPHTLAEMFARASARLTRLSPSQAFDASANGAVLIDIRGDDQIAADGTIPGALIIQRNVLEWRLAPDSEYRHPRAPGEQEQVVVICHEGYQSVLVAATLQELGFARATDLEGGFCAWRDAGLPIRAALSQDRPNEGRALSGVMGEEGDVAAVDDQIAVVVAGVPSHSEDDVDPPDDGRGA